MRFRFVAENVTYQYLPDVWRNREFTENIRLCTDIPFSKYPHIYEINKIKNPVMEIKNI